MDTTPNPAGTGAPVISDDQYKSWLEEMRPFLRQGSSLWRAMDRAGIITHKDSIYGKYRLRDWFSEKVDALRATLGEMVNEAFFNMVESISDKIKEGKRPTESWEIEVLKTVATKHRTAQPFFVDRQEQAAAKPEEFGRIVDIPIIEYVAPAIEGEVVEPKTDETNTSDTAPANPVGTEPETTPSVAPAN